jgi:hypothetical protein
MNRWQRRSVILCLVTLTGAVGAQTKGTSCAGRFQLADSLIRMPNMVYNAIGILRAKLAQAGQKVAPFLIRTRVIKKA